MITYGIKLFSWCFFTVIHPLLRLPFFHFLNFAPLTNQVQMKMELQLNLEPLAAEKFR